MATRISDVAAGFQFGQEVGFEVGRAREILRSVPEGPGVFALFGHSAGDQPYVTRTANLRRRMARLVDPPEAVGVDGALVVSRRLNLRERVGRVAWSVTGSEFESLLVLYHATAEIFGYVEARRRLKLRTPYFLRLTTTHAHPRVYATNRLSLRSLGETYGPFPSRMAADRYCDAVLDLFKLRRCWEDLEVSVEHPGCAYGEMKKCMAPCKVACTAEEYGAEADAVKAFFQTRGESLLVGIGTERDQASAEMDFERAAELHRQYEKVKTAAGLADELVRPVTDLRAVIVQTAAKDPAEETHAEAAAMFLLEHGRLAGPERMSTLGVRAVREQTSVGSSLFAQPLMLQAVPLGLAESGGAHAVVEGERAQVGGRAAEPPEERVVRVLESLRAWGQDETDVAMLSDHLSLLRRWYYRPEKQRAGEVFLPNADQSWPLRRILRGAARAVLGEPKTMQATDREGAKAIRTKVLHEGRPDVERVVPVAEKPITFRSRRRKSVLPGDVA